MKFRHIVFLLLIAAGCDFTNHSPVADSHEFTDSAAITPDTVSVPEIMLERYKRAFEEATNDADKLNALMEACYYAEDVPDEKEATIRQLAAFTEQVPDDCERKTVAYIRLGTLHQTNDVTKAFAYYQKALELLPKFPDNEQLLKSCVYAALSRTCMLNGDYQQAQQYVFEAIPVLEAEQQSQNTKDVIDVNNMLFIAYSAAVDVCQFVKHEDSNKYRQKMFALAETSNRPFDLASAYIGFAYYTVHGDEPGQALEYIEKARKIGLENGYVDIVSSSLDVHSLYEEVKGNIPAARAYLEQSLAYLREKRRPDLEMNVMYNLMCLYPEDDEKQIELNLKGLAIADSIQSKEYAMHFHQSLGAGYSAVGKYREANIHYEKYNDLRDELHNEQTHRQINYLTARFDAERREMKIRDMEERERVRKTQIAGGIAVSAVILSLLWYMLLLRTRRNRALSETNATKDRFFSIISHDLKNPAIAQRDALRMLFDKAPQWDAAALQDYYGELLRSADHQVQLLYNLLGWAQLQTGRMICQPAPFDLVPEVRSELALLRKMAEDKGVALETEFPPEAIVTADTDMISTVVRNLLANAVKFTAQGGTVTLSVSARQKGKHAISVSNTGMGMTNEELQNIFRLDRRHTRLGTSGETGTGLGLTVCRELLGKHGATLHIESREGKGSRFWFEL